MERFEELRSFLQASRVRKEMPIFSEAQIGNHLRDVFDRMAKQSAKQNSTIRLNSGIASVDEVSGGLELGELAVIDGRRSSGRTALALHYAIQTAKETKKPVRICSQTHSAHQITKRLLSMLTYIPLVAIENAELTNEQWNNLYTASCWLKDQDICVYDRYVNPEYLCEALRQCDDLVLLVFDVGIGNEIETSVMCELSCFAKEKQCCVLFTGSRNSIMPYIMGNADKVLSVEHLEDDVYVLDVLWNQYGGLEACNIYWNPYCVCFMDETLYAEENDDA